MRLKIEKLIALLLAMIMVMTFTPVMVFASTLPCGHDSADTGDHSAAECGVPGHYNCDGKKHDEIQCWLDYASKMAGGNLPNIPDDNPPDTPDNPQNPPADTPPPDPSKEPPVPDERTLQRNHPLRLR